MTFLQREIKRGNAYDFLIFDPPAFGRGGKGNKVPTHSVDHEPFVTPETLLCRGRLGRLFSSSRDGWGGAHPSRIEQPKCRVRQNGEPE